MDCNDPRLVFMPENEIKKASGNIRKITDSWWIFVEGKGLALWGKDIKRAAPQCNRDKQVAILVRSKLYPWAELKYFEEVHLPGG